MSDKKKFQAIVRTHHIENWEVYAKDEAEAREMINSLNDEVENVDGAMVDFEIDWIKEVQE
jgi:hypothetical protein